MRHSFWILPYCIGIPSGNCHAQYLLQTSVADIHCRHFSWKPKKDTVHEAPRSHTKPGLWEMSCWIWEHACNPGMTRETCITFCHPSVLLSMGEVSRNIKNKVCKAIMQWKRWSAWAWLSVLNSSVLSTASESQESALTFRCPPQHLNSTSANQWRFRASWVTADWCPSKLAHLLSLHCWDFETMWQN